MILEPQDVTPGREIQAVSLSREVTSMKQVMTVTLKGLRPGTNDEVYLSEKDIHTALKNYFMSTQEDPRMKVIAVPSFVIAEILIALNQELKAVNPDDTFLRDTKRKMIEDIERQTGQKLPPEMKA